jgi:hypothetical protein
MAVFALQMANAESQIAAAGTNLLFLFDCNGVFTHDRLDFLFMLHCS